MKKFFKLSYTKIIFFAFFANTILLTVASAQTEPSDKSPKKINGGFAHLNFSGEQLNLANLNSLLSFNNYGAISSTNFSFGGSGAYVINNFIAGGGGAWLTNSKTGNSSNSLDLKGGYGYFNFGYVVRSNKHSLLYPTVGIGGGGYTILVNKNNQQNDFSQQLKSPSGMISLDAGGWMTTIQLTYQYYLSKKTLEGFCIGIKAGYKYSPYNWSTKMNNTTLANSPKINMNGFYLTIILGGGGTFN